MKLSVLLLTLLLTLTAIPFGQNANSQYRTARCIS